MQNNIKVLLIALFDKDIFKMVAVVAAAIGGGIVKVIFENKQKKLSIWQALASIFVSIVMCYAAYPLIKDLLPESAMIGGIVVIALLSDNIVKYILVNCNDFFKAIINKIWGIKSK